MLDVLPKLDGGLAGGRHLPGPVHTGVFLRVPTGHLKQDSLMASSTPPLEVVYKVTRDGGMTTSDASGFGISCTTDCVTVDQLGQRFQEQKVPTVSAVWQQRTGLEYKRTEDDYWRVLPDKLDISELGDSQLRLRIHVPAGKVAANKLAP